MGIKSRVTISEVAKEAGCSITTVSRVLNNNTTVSAETFAIVEQACKKTGYLQQAKKPSVKSSQKNKLIGVVVTNVLSLYMGRFIKGIEDLLAINGYSLILCGCDHSLEKERENYSRLVALNVKGIIIMPTFEESWELIRKIPSKIPILFLSRSIGPENSGIPFIGTDHVYNGYMGTKYLIGLQHRNICFIEGKYNEYISPAHLRLKEGYKKALSEAGIPFNQDLVVTSPPDQVSLQENLEAIFKKKISFTALMVCNDVMAFDIYFILKKMGYRIPEDFSMIGCDSLPISEAIGLTSIEQNGIAIGREAAYTLIDILEGKSISAYNNKQKATLVIRDSCRMVKESQ
ncbi:LacI family DNA-binding transcriptional regulator [uncultured Sphaerochaeta sp.]|uniref:LacI family DNA-binding transcriptional regulator n=1 Tax=uncultured Sphaerochaeta sp. TaxID=886478 RepID=UPI002A0A6D7D|nr:LacI family DNA-binding transcriptional regulator [uncultured Sphaerochaeta sp.]